jgi:hydrogenase maturation protein HypF
VQAAAGFVERIEGLPDLTRPPFLFPDRYAAAQKLLEKDLRVFRTTSAGRLFDAAAALTGFTRPVTYEAQAAMWFEQRALEGTRDFEYPFADLDFRSLLSALIDDRLRGSSPPEIACRFHVGFARGLAESIRTYADGIDTVVLSGGVFQNQLLLRELAAALEGLDVLVNRRVPCNDGGVSFGQAAIAAVTMGSGVAAP